MVTESQARHVLHAAAGHRCSASTKEQPTNIPRGNWSKRNKIWLNEEGEKYVQCRQLSLMIMFAAHCGLSEHRRRKDTMRNIRGNFYWEDLKEYVLSFVDSYIHCLISDSGDKIPRPMLHALHGSCMNEIIHFDYCWMEDSDNGDKYVLVIKDDLSYYVWLMATQSSDAHTTAECLLKWFSSFGTVLQCVSDRDTHFLNDVVDKIRRIRKSNPHFTHPYCP